jgi:hypothetical protein
LIENDGWIKSEAKNATSSRILTWTSRKPERDDYSKNKVQKAKFKKQSSKCKVQKELTQMRYFFELKD